MRHPSSTMVVVTGVLPWIDANSRPGTRLWLHEVNGLSFRDYQRNDMLRKDVIPTGGPEDADLAAVQYHQEFREQEVQVWQAFGTRSRSSRRTRRRACTSTRHRRWSSTDAPPPEPGLTLGRHLPERGEAVNIRHLVAAVVLAGLAACSRSGTPTHRVEVRRISGDTVQIVPNEGQMQYCLVFTHSGTGVVHHARASAA